MAEGATVYMIIQDRNDGIRDDKFLNNSYDETCMGEPIPRGQLDRLKQRVMLLISFTGGSKKFDYLRAIAIHVDSRNETEQIDVFFYHSDNPKSIALAKTMSDVFQQKYDQFSLGGIPGSGWPTRRVCYSNYKPHPFW
jgi:N-acetylmuramoyl-L-alanine amidase